MYIPHTKQLTNNEKYTLQLAITKQTFSAGYRNNLHDVFARLVHPVTSIPYNAEYNEPPLINGKIRYSKAGYWRLSGFGNRASAERYCNTIHNATNEELMLFDMAVRAIVKREAIADLWPFEYASAPEALAWAENVIVYNDTQRRRYRVFAISESPKRTRKLRSFPHGSYDQACNFADEIRANIGLEPMTRNVTLR